MASATIADTKCLQPISGGEVVLKACDGTKTIANDGSDLFTGWIDSDFKSYGANEPGATTPATRVKVYEMIEDADFATMFGSLSKDTGKLVLTQAQIMEFVRDNEGLLRTGGYATFFLFKSKGKFFVASVYRFGDGGLDVGVYRFEYGFVWSGKDRLRVVVPQLAP